MGKFTGKKRKLNYKPIFYVALVAIPILVVITILIKPAKFVPLKFVEHPSYSAYLSKSGTFYISWRVNQPASSIVYYRFSDKEKFQAMSAAFGDRFVVAIPAKPGSVIEFYVKVSANRQEISSKNYKVKIKAYKPTTKPKNKYK